MTDNGLRVDLHVAGYGVLNGTVHHADQELQLRGTFVGDALLDLADATAAVVGEAGESHRTLRWVNEPDFWQWDFHRDSGQVTVTISYVYEDEEGREPDRRFEAHVSNRALADAILDALDDVLVTFGAAKYDADWSSPMGRVEQRFPYVSYVRLRQMRLRGDAHGHHGVV